MKATIVFQKNWEAIHAKNPDGTRKYRYIINEGSSRSSKTISLIDCYDLYGRSNRNKRMTVWRDTKTDCKKTVLNDALKHLKQTDRWGQIASFNKTESIIVYGTDSTFEIHGTDDVDTVHGLTQDAAWVNEPYNISRDVFDQIDQRTSDFIFIDWNPKKGHWIEDLKKDPRAIVIHSTFKDNPFCPPEQRNKILSYQPVKMCATVTSGTMTEQQAKEYDCEKNPLKLSDKDLSELIRCRENEYKNSASEFNWSVYGLGLKAERPNRIFLFKEIPDEEYFKLDTTRYYGVDWGAVDPWGILEAKYYDGALYLHELNYDSENTWRARMTSNERSQVAGEDAIVPWMFNRLNIPKSAVVVCDNNRAQKILMLRDYGWDYAVAAHKPPGSIVDGIDILNSLKVYYTKSSENLAFEQENYSRKVDTHGEVLEDPEDNNNHLMDPARYIAFFLSMSGIIKRN